MIVSATSAGMTVGDTFAIAVRMLVLLRNSEVQFTKTTLFTCLPFSVFVTGTGIVNSTLVGKFALSSGVLGR